MLFPIFALALPIMISDLARNKIPNIYLTYTAILIAPVLIVQGLGPLMRLIAILLLILALNLVHLGMGDIKLLWLITFSLNPIATTDFAALFLAIIGVSTFHILLITVYTRALPLQIPLAPSIFIGLGLYLAARYS